MYLVKRWFTAAISKVWPSQKPPAQQEEEVQCHDVVIFYNLVFDIGKPINPTQAARDLLNKDFACTSGNHITGTIEIASRFKKLRNEWEKGALVAIFASYIKKREWKALFS